MRAEKGRDEIHAPCGMPHRDVRDGMRIDNTHDESTAGAIDGRVR